jgi:hypothetical protein
MADRPERKVSVTLTLEVRVDADEWVTQEQLDAVPDEQIVQAVRMGVGLDPACSGWIDGDNLWYARDVDRVEVA